MLPSTRLFVHCFLGVAIYMVRKFHAITSQNKMSHPKMALKGVERNDNIKLHCPIPFDGSHLVQYHLVLN